MFNSQGAANAVDAYMLGFGELSITHLPPHITCDALLVRAHHLGGEDHWGVLRDEFLADMTPAGISTARAVMLSTVECGRVLADAAISRKG